MIRKIKDELSLLYYKCSGSKPWSRGYGIYRNRLVTQELSSPDSLNTFATSEPLPDKFGIGVDERCVEFPWVMSRVQKVAGSIFDAGSTLNQEHVLSHKSLQDRQIHIFTLAPEPVHVKSEHISYIYGDLRDIPVKDNFYDSIVSISVIEHVGFDNSIFTENKKFVEASENEHKKVLAELWRILKPGGELLITLPFGRLQKFDTFQQFDINLLNEFKQQIPISVVEEAFYKYSPSGWQIAAAEDCSDCEYFELCMLSPKQRENAQLVSTDGAAAARAVVCLRWVKEV